MVTPDKDQKLESGSFKTLSLVLALAASFLLWGFLLFYAIGDKGPPSWDFGIVQDIPGESIHSTFHPFTGIVPGPEPQHVSEKPQGVRGEEKKTGGN
jgi:hypothetical protein